jgi:histone-lysine N-methyltransferase SETMAR
MKTVLITFLGIEGIVHFEFIPQGQTVNKAYYAEILKRLLEAVRRKWPEVWPNDWVLQHDNATAHKALSVKQFLAKNWISETERPPYYPDLAPNDFWLFPEKSVT